MRPVASWGLKLTPGQPQKFSIPDDLDSLFLRITNVAYGEKLVDANERTVVKIAREKGFLEGPEDEEIEDEEEVQVEELVLAVLLAGKVETQSVNMEFGNDLLQFEVVGKNEVHLLGSWVDYEDDDEPGMSDLDDSDEEDALHLDEVSSDVEYPADALELDSDEEGDESRFEEIADVPKAGKRTADAMEEDAPAASVGSNGTLSKKEKKKLAKKLKNEAGQAVTVTEAVSVTSTTAASPSAEKKEKKADKKEEKSDKKEDFKVLAGGLKIKDAKKGEGKAAKAGQTVKMRYIGKLENGKVFDSNTSGPPFTFRLGAGEVIKGWDQGLVGMQVGGERVLVIPHELAYGKRGSKPDIPPKATLRFEVKMVEIK